MKNRLMIFMMVITFLFVYNARGQEYVTTLISKGIRTFVGEPFAEFNGKLYFPAGYYVPLEEEEQIGLWMSDGTTSGTVVICNLGLAGFSSLQYLTNVNNTLFFSVQFDKLYKYGGTFVELVKDINPGAGSSNLANLVNVNGILFFKANDGINGNELWKSDGSSGGTVLVRDINSGVGGSDPQYLTPVNDVVFFAANNGGSGNELWRSLGTSGSTWLVKDINSGAGSSNPAYIVNLDGTLLFSANNGTSGTELWKSDGTALGTLLVNDINPGVSSSNPANLTNVNGTIFFAANNGTNGTELWKSDGTPEGTMIVKDINPGAGNSNPMNLANINGTLFFIADDGIHGVELWKSDGTPDGTVLVKDINPGIAGSGDAYFTKLVKVDSLIFFGAFEISHGLELWKSDGTESGTVLAKDIFLGESYSYPENLTNVNDILFFVASESGETSGLWTSRPREAMGKFLSITDIPNDQGGQVRIKWQRSLWDTVGWVRQVTSYSIMRRIPTGGSVMSKSKIKIPQSLILDDTLSNYDYLMNITALQIPEYNVVATTLGDSTSTGTNRFHYLLLAHTSDPNNYYIASEDSGYSVDNLSPAFVTGLNAIVQTGPNVYLNWNPNTVDPDVGRYDIYRSEESGFIPNQSLKIGTSASPTFTDSSPELGVNNYYIVMTVDVHGNESGPSSEEVAAVAVTQNYVVSDKWNMISVPLQVNDYSKSVLYTSSTSEAFAYEGTYITYDTLRNGIGYWLKFSESQQIENTGLYRKIDTLDVFEGWNMIGSLSDPIQAGTITSDPPRMVTSQLFAYNGTYVSSDTIYPGKGYWIKVTKSGQLILVSADLKQVKPQTDRIHIVPTSELPPPPPDGSVSSNPDIPKEYALGQAYPNPFNPSTTISYQLPVQSYVTLKVFDVLGCEVATLVNGEQTAGYKSVTWDATVYPSGIYFYRMETVSMTDPSKIFIQVKKMLLVK